MLSWIVPPGEEEGEVAEVAVETEGPEAVAVAAEVAVETNVSREIA